MCDICADTGYIKQDIGTATIPDIVDIACRCNPEPSDFDYPEFDVPYVDFDPPFRDRDCSLPSWLLA